MELLIVRHGAAASLPMDEAGPPLSDPGKESIQKLSALLKGQSFRPEGIYVSPLRRAQETADYLQGIWSLASSSVNWLKPGVEPSRILKELNSLKFSSIVLVGHLPTLGWLLSVLVWGLPPKEVSLPKASATLLKTEDWEPAKAKLQWMLHPQMKL